MTIRELLTKFTIFYILAIIGVGLILKYLNIDRVSSINVVILMTTIMLLTESFAKKNGRYFDTRESKKTIIGLSLINLIIQFTFSLLALSANGQSVDLGVILIATMFVACLHTLGIILIIKVYKKNLIKRKIING